MELSVARISLDVSDFEIMPKDADYASDTDRLQSLLEAEQGRYSSFFVIGRGPNPEDTEGDRDDLWALRDYPGGVYILISNRLSEQNRRSVFVGMAGFNDKMFGAYERQTGINLQLESTDRFMTLAQCLEEQNENPPPNMKYWDLAIVIPEQEHDFELFVALQYIFNKAEGFIVRTKVNEKASNKLINMNKIQQTCVNSYMEFELPSIVASISYFPSLEAVLASFLAAVLINVGEKLWKKLGPREKLKSIWESCKKKRAEKSKQKGSTSDENDDSDEKKIKNWIDNIVKLLNKNFPRKLNLFPRKVRKPHDYFDE